MTASELCALGAETARTNYKILTYGDCGTNRQEVTLALAVTLSLWFLLLRPTSSPSPRQVKDGLNLRKVDIVILAALASPFPVVEVYPDGAVMGSRLQDEFCHIPVRVGDDVECNYKDFGVWYPATVTGIDDSGETLQVACARPPPRTPYTRAHTPYVCPWLGVVVVPGGW